MYRRAEFALGLKKEGYSKAAIIPFLNSETQAGYWIKDQKELKKLFLQFLVDQGMDCGDASSVNRKIFILMLLNVYNIFINKMKKCIIAQVVQLTKIRGRYG
jgi:hypothetical protein